MFANTQMMGMKVPKPDVALTPAPAREKDEQDLQGNAAVQGKVTETAKQQAAGTPTLDMIGPMGVPLVYSAGPNAAQGPIPYPNIAPAGAAQAGDKKKGREI